MTRSILLKGTLALALLPAAVGGVALASSSPARTPTPAAQVLPAAPSPVSQETRGRATEPGEDHLRTTPAVVSALKWRLTARITGRNVDPSPE